MCSWRLYAEHRKKILTWISPRFHGTRSVTVLGRNLLTPCTTARGPTSNRRTGPKFAKSTLRRTLLISRVCFRTIGYTKKSIKLRRDAADGTQCRPKKPRYPTTTFRPGPRPQRKHRPAMGLIHIHRVGGASLVVEVSRTRNESVQG